VKPASITSLLEHIGPAKNEPPARREPVFPLRPRLLSGARGESRVRPALTASQEAEAEAKAFAEPSFPRPISPRNSNSAPPPEPASFVRSEANSAEAVARRLAEARGREEGLAEGRAEAEAQFARELAAFRDEAEKERLEFQEREYARLETTIRVGLDRLSDDIGSAAARILTRFLTDRLTARAADELKASVARICAGAPSGAIKIRGPESLVRLLKERAADLPAEIRYVPDGGVEAVIEVGPTRIATELRAWSELLASLEDKA